MSKSQRLASFGGPSTPNKLNKTPSNPPSPGPQRNLSETTFHRKIRACLLDFRNAIHTWRDLVFLDGVKAVRTLIDTRTELENSLKMYGLPSKPLVGEKLKIMNQKIQALDSIMIKVSNQLSKMDASMESIESLLNEAHRTKGWSWVVTEPLWVSWPIERFYKSLLPILPKYIEMIEYRKDVLSSLRSHDVSFERSKELLRDWADQGEDEWVELEELFSVEVDGWPVRKV